MLYYGGNYVFLAFCGKCLRHTLQCPVIGFTSAGSQIYFLRKRADTVRNCLSRLIKMLCGFDAFRMK